MSISKPALRVTPEAPKDKPHRAPDGTLLDLGIEGVVLEHPPRHIDHRGSLFEAVSFGFDREVDLEQMLERAFKERMEAGVIKTDKTPKELVRLHYRRIQ